jgi:hypothetical protein
MSRTVGAMSSVDSELLVPLISLLEAVKKGFEHVKLKNLHC